MERHKLFSTELQWREKTNQSCSHLRKIPYLVHLVHKAGVCPVAIVNGHKRNTSSAWKHTMSTSNICMHVCTWYAICIGTWLHVHNRICKCLLIAWSNVIAHTNAIANIEWYRTLYCTYVRHINVECKHWSHLWQCREVSIMWVESIEWTKLGGIPIFCRLVSGGVVKSEEVVWATDCNFTYACRKHAERRYGQFWKWKWSSHLLNSYLFHDLSVVGLHHGQAQRSNPFHWSSSQRYFTSTGRQPILQQREMGQGLHRSEMTHTHTLTHLNEPSVGKGFPQRSKHIPHQIVRAAPELVIRHMTLNLFLAV